MPVSSNPVANDRNRLKVGRAADVGSQIKTSAEGDASCGALDAKAG